jgi:tetratricopeptide (TPR) repeat protein
VYLYSFDFELSYYTDFGEYDKAHELIRKSIDIFTELEHKTLLPNRMVTYFNIAYAFFGSENYRKSLEWLNKAIDISSRTGLRQDIYTASLVINLIIHYELGNDSLLPYVVRSTYRQLKKRKLLFKFERSILDFIRLKMPKIYTKQERIAAFIELKKVWDVLAKDPQEKENFSNWDFLSWLESKISGKKFSDTVYKNAEKNFGADR